MTYVRQRRRRAALGTSLTSTALISYGANAIIPGSGPIVGAGLGILNSLFGGAGRDAQRQARCDWFAQAARQGSVLAARVLYGGIANTASHESPMYQKAIQTLLSNPQWAPIVAEAQQRGPYWRTDDNDTADKMRAEVETDLLQRAASQQGESVPGTSSGGGGSRNTLPAVVSRAPYNYAPLLIGAAVAAAGVAFLYSGRRR